VAALAAFLVVEVLTIAADAERMNLTSLVLRGGAVSDTDAAGSDAFIRLTAILEGVTIAVAALMFLMWLHRVVANGPAMGGKALRFTPRWAVGWWFVPFANLLRPFQVVSEAWRTASPADAHMTPDTRGMLRLPVFLRLWWGLWLLGYVLSRFVSAQSRGDGANALHDAAATDIVASLALGGAAALCIALVWRLTRLQDQKQLLRYRGSEVTAVTEGPVAP
jgi:hypothetical protein